MALHSTSAAPSRFPSKCSETALAIVRPERFWRPPSMAVSVFKELSFVIIPPWRQQCCKNPRSVRGAGEVCAYSPQKIFVLRYFHPVKPRPLAGVAVEAHAARGDLIFNPAVHFLTLDGCDNPVAGYSHRYMVRGVVMHHHVHQRGLDGPARVA